MRLAVMFSLILLVGCSDPAAPGAKQQSIAKQAGSKVGEAVTDFAAGVGAGVDTQLKVPVELSPALVAAGLSFTVAKSEGLDSDEIVIYLIAKQALTAKLIAKAVDAQGDEVGRTKADVNFDADDAKYVTFKFDSYVDSKLVTKYVLELGKQTAEPAVKP